MGFVLVVGKDFKYLRMVYKDCKYCLYGLVKIYVDIFKT